MSQQGIILPLPRMRIRAGLSKEQIAEAEMEFFIGVLVVMAVALAFGAIIIAVERIVK